MNLSHDKNSVVKSSKTLVPHSTSPLLADQPELDLGLCDKFGLWLDHELDQLVEQLDEFVTRDSLRRNLRQR